jgi:cobalt/nickel transport system permease protein
VRTKLLLLFCFLVSIALLKNPSALQLFIYLAYLLVIFRAANLPLVRMLRISLILIPFLGLFALMVYVSGDLRRALLILVKSYLSALAVMACVASTPLPKLVQAARSLYVPAFLAEVTQLIYRYVFVLGSEIQVMRVAFSARAGRPGRRAFQSASGMLAVLFGRAFEKATAVHNAMLSRGFNGTLSASLSRRPNISEFALFCAGLSLVVAVHFL